MSFRGQKKFQSALPRGERRSYHAPEPKFYHFNPRSREGSDGKLPDLRRVYDISIRAPARGATGRDALITGVRTISIRAPARGATFLYDSDDVQLSFQSALPRGERLSLLNCTMTAMIFQSALPRGERQST